MTENKRFTTNIHRIYDNNEEIACADTMDDAEILVELLKDMSKIMKFSKLAYNQLSSYVDANFDEYMTQKKLNERIRELKTENEQLKKENKHLRCTIESNSQDDYIDYLEKQNERLKERITELASNDKIVFINGQY